MPPLSTFSSAIWYYCSLNITLVCSWECCDLISRYKKWFGFIFSAKLGHVDIWWFLWSFLSISFKIVCIICGIAFRQIVYTMKFPICSLTHTTFSFVPLRGILYWFFPDIVPIEFTQALEKVNKKKFTNILKNIYQLKEIPEEWLQSSFIIQQP